MCENERFTNCPICNKPYYYIPKKKCIACGYNKDIDEFREAVQELKEVIADEIIKVVKWLRNIFMEEVE